MSFKVKPTAIFGAIFWVGALVGNLGVNTSEIFRVIDGSPHSKAALVLMYLIAAIIHATIGAVFYFLALFFQKAKIAPVAHMTLLLAATSGVLFSAILRLTGPAVQVAPSESLFWETFTLTLVLSPVALSLLMQMPLVRRKNIGTG